MASNQNWRKQQDRDIYFKQLNLYTIVMKLDIAIIGGGLSGLTAAHILNEHNIDFCLFVHQPA